MCIECIQSRRLFKSNEGYICKSCSKQASNKKSSRPATSADVTGREVESAPVEDGAVEMKENKE